MRNSRRLFRLGSLAVFPAVLAVGPLIAATAGTGDAAAATTAYTATLIPTGLTTLAIAVDSATQSVYLGSTNDQVTVVSEGTHAVEATISLPGEPRGIAVDPANGNVYVSVQSSTAPQSEIAVIDGATNSLSATSYVLPTGSDPDGIAVDTSTGMLYAADQGQNTVTAINTATNVVTSFSSGGTNPFSVAVDENTGVLWVANESGSAVAISEANPSAQHSIALTGRPVSVAVDPDTDTVYVVSDADGAVSVINGATYAVTTPNSSLAYAAAVAVDPAADLYYVTSQIPTAGYGVTWVIDGASNTIVNTTDRGGFQVAADPANGSLFEAPLGTHSGAWAFAPSASEAMSPVFRSQSASLTTGVSGSFTITGNSAIPAATFTETGTLPPGITLTPGGVLQGTPAAGSGGLYPITVTASNGVPPDYSQPFTLTVLQPPTISAAPSATFQVGTAVSFPIQATGYPAPTVQASALPAGVVVSHQGSTGWQLSGTPAVGSGGLYYAEISANSSAGVASVPVTLTVLEPPSFTSAPAATFRTGTVNNNYLVTTGGYPGPTITATGLPAGIHLDIGGLLWGEPAKGGIYTFTITASNGVGAPATQAFTLTVDQAPKFNSAGHATFSAGRHHTFTIRTTAFPTARLSERGKLPRGISFRAGANGTAVLTGVPARADIGKKYVITITATNGAGKAVHQTFTLRIS